MCKVLGLEIREVTSTGFAPMLAGATGGNRHRLSLACADPRGYRGMPRLHYIAHVQDLE